jgi:predicted CXXCH cytochrome family protein
VVHPPFEDGCPTCHSSSSGFETRLEGASLCRDCHEDSPESLERSNLHKALSEGGGCTNCHNPHFGFSERLLLMEGDGVCFTCHDRKRILGGENLHEPLNEGCTACHDPHGSDFTSLLPQEVNEFCIGCHEESVNLQHMHPVGGDKLDPRTGEVLSCASCHSPHSSDFSRLLTHDQGRELCVQCHRVGEDFR